MDRTAYENEAERILKIIDRFSISNNLIYHSIADSKDSNKYLIYGIKDSYASVKFNEIGGLKGFKIYIEDSLIKEKLTYLIHEYGHVLDFYHLGEKQSELSEDNRNIIATEIRAWIYGIKLLSDIRLLNKNSFYESIMSYVYDLSDYIPFSEEGKYNDFIDCILFDGDISVFNPQMFSNKC